jgi:hypothetical protein
MRYRYLASEEKKKQLATMWQTSHDSVSSKLSLYRTAKKMLDSPNANKPNKKFY